VSPDPAASLMVVDAWVNNRAEPQVIRLSQSQGYFDVTEPMPVTGARVEISDTAGSVFIFREEEAGAYTWRPDGSDSLGAVNTVLTLEIEVDNSVYRSTTAVHRVPPIDTIKSYVRTNDIRGPDGLYAEFFSRDPLGTGDTYWIKSFKNGVFLNKPQELNIAYDAGFDAGSATDGIIFITPIRELVNRIPDPDTEDNEDVAPWKPGDEVRVEIHSISLEAFTFLDIARDQMTNGDNTIFAIPLSNTRGNVIDLESGEPVLGIFNVAAVSAREAIIE
jgi:hypothetical protein